MLFGSICLIDLVKRKCKSQSSSLFSVPQPFSFPESPSLQLGGQGRKVNIEYVSANPTGPLHVGHTRGAVCGDALASLLDYAG